MRRELYDAMEYGNKRQKNVIELNRNEKKVLCIEFARYVPKLRSLLHLTQREFGNLCGISVDRLSRIENGHAVMTWGQYISILFVCMIDLNAKEYLLSNNIVSMRVLQYFQRKDESVLPSVNVIVHEEIEKEYIRSSMEQAQ